MLGVTSSDILQPTTKISAESFTAINFNQLLSISKSRNFFRSANMESTPPVQPDQYKAHALLETKCHPIYDRLDLEEARETTSVMSGILKHDYTIPSPNVNQHLEIRLAPAPGEPKDISEAMEELSLLERAERYVAEHKGAPKTIAEAMEEMSLLERAEKDVARQKVTEDAEEERQWLLRAILATLALDYLQKCRDRAPPKDSSWKFTLDNFEPNEFLEHIWICLNRGVNGGGAARTFEGEPVNARANGIWFVQRAQRMVQDVLEAWEKGVPLRDITPFYAGRSMEGHFYQRIWE
jgi:hypothetical protein